MVGDLIADAIAELDREHGLGSLGDSIWAQQPAAEEKKKKKIETPLAKKVIALEARPSPRVSQ